MTDTSVAVSGSAWQSMAQLDHLRGRMPSHTWNSLHQADLNYDDINKTKVDCQRLLKPLHTPQQSYKLALQNIRDTIVHNPGNFARSLRNNKERRAGTVVQSEIAACIQFGIRAVLVSL